MVRLVCWFFLEGLYCRSFLGPRGCSDETHGRTLAPKTIANCSWKRLRARLLRSFACTALGNCPTRSQGASVQPAQTATAMLKTDIAELAELTGPQEH